MSFVGFVWKCIHRGILMAGILEMVGVRSFRVALEREILLAQLGRLLQWLPSRLLFKKRAERSQIS